MTKEQYAQEIAQELDYEVKLYHKNGNDAYGITLPMVEGKMAPIIYIDEMYRREVSVEDAVNYIKDYKYDADSLDLDYINSLLDNYKAVKPKLHIKLFNQNALKDSRYVGVSAEKYGFDDLVIIPYINLSDNFSMTAGAHIERWGISLEQLVEDSLANTNYSIKTFYEMLKDRFGDAVVPTEFADDTSRSMIIVSDKEAGAGAIIKAQDELKEMLPQGYYAVPSSISEFIVFPKMEGMSKDFIDSMVSDINANELPASEILSDRAYEF